MTLSVLKETTKSFYRFLKKSIRTVDTKLAPPWLQSQKWGGRISLSDNGAYPVFCQTAAADPNIFATFRASRIYRTILEHVSMEHAQVYLEEIRKSEEIFESLSECRKNDEVGGPLLSDVGDLKQISTTTLRYMKVAADLKAIFGSLDGFSIYEVGVGYGGQCRINDAIWKLNRYTLVDLRQVLELAEVYLDHFPIRTQLRYSTMNCLGLETPDLFISNYAFTELPRHIQDIYIEKMIRRARRGYITFNDMNPAHYRSWSVREICNLIPNARVLPETPLTYEKNCLIIWGD